MRKSIEKIFSKSMMLAFAILMGLGLWLTGLSSLLDNPAFAESVLSGTSDVTVRVKDIITLRILDSSASSEIDNLTLGLTPTPNGTFTKGSFNVDASTSNVTGYKLYMTSIGTSPVSDTSDNPTYTTNLVNTDSSVNDNIPTFAANSSVTEADFRVRNSAYKNKWGYSLADLDITDTSSIIYHNIPAHTENRQIDEKNTAIESGLTPVTIGVNASNNIASGAYKNKLVVSAVANPIPTAYTLAFDLDGGFAPSSNPDIFADMIASEIAAQHTFTIPEIKPEKSGYTLSHWEDKMGNHYEPGGTITVVGNEGYTGFATLVAKWRAASFWTIATMQEMTVDICSTAITPPITATKSDITGEHNGDADYIPETYLQDTRYLGGDSAHTFTTGGLVGNAYAADALGKSGISANGWYRVRKLADGNCWMSENLNLPQSTVQIYTSGDTDLNDGLKAWVPGYDYMWGNQAYYDLKQDPNYYDTNMAHDHTYYGYGLVTVYGQQNGKTVTGYTRVLETSDATPEKQDSGVFYNINAATAGTSAALSNGTASSSVCPLGWKLPNGNDWSIIMDYYTNNATKLMQFPTSLVAAGNYFWNNPSLMWQKQGNSEYRSTYLTSVVSASYATSFHGMPDLFRVINGGVDASFSKENGASVRCLNRND